jgi:hypothetical protein
MREALLEYIKRNERKALPLKSPQPLGRLPETARACTITSAPRSSFSSAATPSLCSRTKKPTCSRVRWPSCPPASLTRKSSTRNRASFRNLVVGFYSNTISLHFAFEAAPQKPDIEFIKFYDTPNLEHYVALTNQLVEVYHSTSPVKEFILKGIVTNLLASFLDLVETGNNSLNRDIGKVFQTKWIVREQIANPDLNVKLIASTLQCSADYLSHLFPL